MAKKRATLSRKGAKKIADHYFTSVLGVLAPLRENII